MPFLLILEVEFPTTGLQRCGGCGTNFKSFCDDDKCALRTRGVALALESPLDCLDI